MHDERNRVQLVADLKKVDKVDGWYFEDVYPGALSFSKGRVRGDGGSWFSALTVTCWPDWTKPGVIDVQVTAGTGECLDIGGEVPYKSPLTAAEFVEPVRPFLKKAEPYLPRPRRRR